MNEEKAKIIVSAISAIARGQAAIELNVFCDNAESAEKNTILVEGWKKELIKLLSTTPTKE